MFQGCSSLSSVNIPNSVTSIVNHAFQGCSSLSSVDIPNGVTFIGEGAFLDAGLTSITVPDLVKCINGSTFQNCGKLEKVILPASLDSIGEDVFRDCNSLKVIECNGTTPPAVNPNAFTNSDITGTSICVPYGSVDAYRNAPVWKDFKNIGAYPAGIRLDKHSVTVKGSTALKLNAYLLPYDAVQGMKWHTKNINVAEVNNGTVRFKASGTAAIVATTYNGIFRDSCLIRVLEDNFDLDDGRPTFADSLLGEWVACDENFQDIPNPEIFGFWKTVATSPEGYQTVKLNCRYNNGFVERTVSNFWIDETARLVNIRTTAYTYLGVIISELTANTITAQEMVFADPYYFKRVK
jgi:hypothetical protein